MPRKVIDPTAAAAPIRAIRFDADDEHLLLELCKLEKLSLSDVVRRALRHYAAAMGVTKPTKRAK